MRRQALVTLFCVGALGVATLGACSTRMHEWAERSAGDAPLTTHAYAAGAPTGGDAGTEADVGNGPAPAFVAVAQAVDIDPDPGVVHFVLEASPNPDDPRWPWRYNGTVPGPTLRANRGDRVIIDFANNLPSATSVHWHGLRVPFGMDGATDHPIEHPTLPAEAPVGAGASFRYEFVVEQSGTFWYHPHIDTDAQLDGGLYGMFVVADPAEPATAEVELVFDVVEAEYGSDGHNGTHTKAADGSGDPSHGDHTGELRNDSPIAPTWMVNGVVAPELRVPQAGVVRARVVNVSNMHYVALPTTGFRVIGGDQGLLSAAGADPLLVLGPGDRAELELPVGSEPIDLQARPYTRAGGLAWGPSQQVMRVVSDGGGALPEAVDWPFSGRAASVDPGRTDIVYAFAGSDSTHRWLINGEAWPDVTVESVGRDQELIVEVRNLSPTEHPFHTHGLDFEVLAVNGVVPEVARFEDTINVGIRDVVRLRLVANNPGTWMVHCHVLPHVGEGMMTLLEVRE